MKILNSLINVMKPYIFFLHIVTPKQTDVKLDNSDAGILKTSVYEQDTNVHQYIQFSYYLSYQKAYGIVATPLMVTVLDKIQKKIETYF